MTQPIIPRAQVADQLAVPLRVLVRYESRGLVRAVRSGDGVEGYGPAEIRRVWSIVSFQRDLGINLPGVEAILKLRDHMEEVHRHLDILAQALHEVVESESESDPEPPTHDDA